MNSTVVGRLRTVVGTLLLGLAMAIVPVASYAQHGGGHFGGGAHFGGAHFGGAHFGGARVGVARGAVGRVGVARGAVGRYYGARGFVGRSVAFGHAYWGGGYWHGVWWPRAYYFGYFPWFLAALPWGLPVYWWGGIPYYYYDDVYYTYDPADGGYVVTDPPPAGGTGAVESTAPPAGAAPAPGPSSNGDVYVYPRNGQSEAQTAKDRYECHKWAVSQTGFDPTVSGSGGDPSNYRRAITACLDARGYSAN